MPVARALARRRFIGRELLITALGAPLLLPMLVAVLGLLGVFDLGRATLLALLQFALCALAATLAGGLPHLAGLPARSGRHRAAPGGRWRWRSPPPRYACLRHWRWGLP